MHVYDKRDPNSIRELFASIAQRYDMGNAVLSMQLYRRWNRQLIEHVLEPSPPKILLDLCCGTGDIAFTYLQKAPKPPETIYMIDFCAEMLANAKAKGDRMPSRSEINYIVGDAQKIPLPDASVDSVTIAYGIRNVTYPAQCISETYRILKPGGRIGILELTRPSNPFMRFGHSLYLRSVVPVVGRFLTSNQNAYEYLRKSISHFIPATDLQRMFEETGFSNTQVIPLCGGIATIVSGFKRF
ncbi:MAG: bifunctional demethylmenaquinone methyltransferase/2-methoxy-6-polyprenyl-1,4-benzoquinol methylase UbiE [Chlamydiales bacterium]|nr:bifunctional demethylmenaquinone methyltransferase/2-methoxy-6-polyprenyl-1,4-benzoquinol methylase UbiE [Chlamydiales bacterium]